MPASTPGGVSVVLDESGESLSSMQLAKRLEGWRDRGVPEARLLIRAAAGHEEDVRAEADLLLSFGPATWPILLERAMLAAKLYRAPTTLSHTAKASSRETRCQ